MKPLTIIRKFKTGYTPLFLFALIFGVATPAAATPYSILIENPTVWKITGTFDSLIDTWNVPTDISNWEFSAEVFTPTNFTVGPLIDGIDTLNMFQGSLSTGIRNINVFEVGGDNLINYSDLLPNNFFVTLTGGGEAFFQTDSKVKINKTVDVVPEPTTALLLMTGLAGLAGYRWSQARRQTK